MSFAKILENKKEELPVLLMLYCTQHGHYGEGPRETVYYYFEPGTFPYTENAEAQLFKDYQDLNRQATYFLSQIGGKQISAEKAVLSKIDKIYKFRLKLY